MIITEQHRANANASERGEKAAAKPYRARQRSVQLMQKGRGWQPAATCGYHGSVLGLAAARPRR